MVAGQSLGSSNHFLTTDNADIVRSLQVFRSSIRVSEGTAEEPWFQTDHWDKKANQPKPKVYCTEVLRFLKVTVWKNMWFFSFLLFWFFLETRHKSGLVVYIKRHAAKGDRYLQCVHVANGSARHYSICNSFLELPEKKRQTWTTCSNTFQKKRTSSQQKRFE